MYAMGATSVVANVVAFMVHVNFGSCWTPCLSFVCQKWSYAVAWFSRLSIEAQSEILRYAMLHLINKRWGRISKLGQECYPSTFCRARPPILLCRYRTFVAALVGRGRSFARSLPQTASFPIEQNSRESWVPPSIHPFRPYRRYNDTDDRNGETTTVLNKV